MKKLLTLILVFSTAPFFSQNITQSELLGRPTNNSITIQAFFDADVDVAIQFGTSSGNYTSQTPWTNVIANNPAELLLTGLSANTKYFYRMLYRQPNATAFTIRTEHTFQTQRPVGSTYKYVVQADPHMDEQSNIPLYQLCLQNQLDDNPDFMIDLGDFIMTDKLKNLTTNTIPHDTIPYRCKLLRSNYERLCHSVPLFIALGNHEGESGWNLNGTPNNIAVWNTQERQKYFLNPTFSSFYAADSVNDIWTGQRSSWYAWTWGDALFVALDPYWNTVKSPTSDPWTQTLGAKQYLWLSDVLKTSTAKHKFIFIHNIIGGLNGEMRGGLEAAPYFEWGGKSLDGTDVFNQKRPGWAMPLHQLFVKNAVTAVFHGHDHLYAKQDLDGIVYQEVPQPSAINFSNFNSIAASYGYKSGTILGSSGFIKVTVNAKSVQSQYIRTWLAKDETSQRKNGELADAWLVNKP